MLIEGFIAATCATSVKTNFPNTLKDVGIIIHELQPQSTIRHGFKKSSAKINSVTFSNTHIFAAQADRAVVLVYNRDKGNQEATIPFPERITSLEYIGDSSGFLILGTEGGRLNVWDVASGRQTISTASHLQPVSSISVLPGNTFILSGSPDSNVHIWSLPQLVSFSQPQSLSLHDPGLNTPVRTFPNHRSGITALTCGHSKPLSNFAVSTSSDSTCYVWKTSDCQILRTILFSSAPQCLAIDPADRALYSGHEDGSIQFFDFYNLAQKIHNFRSSGSTPTTQLDAKDGWSPSIPDIGTAQCLTLSYDGTILVSGHASGRIISWDIAHRRVQKVITDLGNSVTNIAMERPKGLPSQDPYIQVNTVVKPRLDSPSSSQIGTFGIPSDYSLQVQITPPPRSRLLTPPTELDFLSILSHPAFPKSLIDEAILDLTSPSTSTQTTQLTNYDISFDADPLDTTQSSQISQLESRIALLEENLSIYVSAAERSRTRRLARMERREQYGQRKREAYFTAVRKGEDKEREVDEESDEVELGEEVYADV
jgi:pre-rRNA-processing protein IPI3